MTTAAWWLAACLPLAVLAGIWWRCTRRRPADAAAQRTVIRQLQELITHLPTQQLLRDPDTGTLVGLQRPRGSVVVMVADPDSATNPHAVATFYSWSGTWRPTAVWRLQQPAHADGRAPGWRDAWRALWARRATGAMDASLDELRELHAILRRVHDTH